MISDEEIMRQILERLARKPAPAPVYAVAVPALSISRKSLLAVRTYATQPMMSLGTLRRLTDE